MSEALQMQPKPQGDVYPSRTGGETTIMKRQDPVVYGTVDSGPLSKEQLEFYDKNGYLVLDRFFSADEVEAYRNELKRLWIEGRTKEAREIIREPESREVRSIFAVHRDNEVFKRLSEDTRLVSIMQQILASDVYIHQSRINYKPGFSGKEFYWHSDFETWHVEDGMPRMRALSCSIALEDNYVHNGPLMVIPGSQKHYISCPGETPDDNFLNSLRKQEIGVPDHDSLEFLASEGGIESLTGPAGSIILFDCNTMHGSNGNITPFPRSNIFYVYNSVENKLQAPYSGLKPRPDYIATRD
ncbi:ectoine hydroxylase [Paenibacillus turpanensis]|uniref:ectoine hydroxylase n=1 Tax=Paenibacillus turpanensis TaxID=2689078 RepID=UPI0014080B4A|nr:ectoine hydroxylase [Paenibacillus turpanensis]